jgi:hypothetical protein
MGLYYALCVYSHDSQHRYADRFDGQGHLCGRCNTERLTRFVICIQSLPWKNVMAPVEGFPPSGGTGWLIPNAFGTLPVEQVFDIFFTLLCLHFFFSLHSLGTSCKFLRVYASPWAFVSFRVLTPMIVSIVMLRDSTIKVICVADIILRS